MKVRKFNQWLNESRDKEFEHIPSSGHVNEATVDIDFVGDKSDIKNAAKQFNVTISKGKGQGHDLKGKKKDILKYLQSDFYDMDMDDIKEFYPELLESINEGE